MRSARMTNLESSASQMRLGSAREVLRRAREGMRRTCPIGTAPSGQEGLLYSAANGEPLRNEGLRIIRGRDASGRSVELPFQLTDVHKPLASVAKMLDAGNAVVYHPGGSYIINLTGNSAADKAFKTLASLKHGKTTLRRENVIYNFDVCVGLDAIKAAMGFQRPCSIGTPCQCGHAKRA